ncbi:hypothetical protein AFM11_18240 [Mycolicibacterium wolinskyi]|uniref:Uncharacterized protein n=1 Tax=Mycolicibacterium wolinskyi TaxID=59750 RepID=A0A132PKQ8_9MYCO|nr:hypothetical protein AFM11_18240 [Mycolicibacterium wolinskyi]
MVRKRRKREWPGRPRDVWAEASRRHGVPSLPRPEVPNWRDIEVFGSRVLLHPATPSPPATVGFGAFTAMLALLAWWKDHPTLLVGALGVAAAILVSVGCFWMWWVPARRERRLSRTHARALDYGVGAHAYRTRFTRPEESSQPRTTSLLIDERLPTFAASRLQHAVRDWLARVTADAAMNAEAVHLLGRRWVVPITEIFGPDAHGGWLVIDQGEDDTPWRLLIDRPDGPEEYFYDEVMAIDGPPGRLYLDGF